MQRKAIKKTLNSEFKTILLRDSRDISEKSFKCQAKLDKNGKIVCKINVDIEANFDSYEDFLLHFCFPEE